MSFKIKISNVGNGQRFQFIGKTPVYQVLVNDFLGDTGELEYFNTESRAMFITEDRNIPVLFLNWFEDNFQL